MPDEFDSFDTLFYLVLAHLETTPYSRSFRMQALYTLSSQLLVTTVLLAGYYAVLGGVKLAGVAGTTIRSFPTLVVLLAVATVFVVVFRVHAGRFISLWNHYAKLEFYLDCKLDVP